MRLIDADEFIANLKDYINKPMTAGLCATLIELAPTAYDIDKVVEELKLHSFEFGTDSIPAHYLRFNEAIEIVNQGGVSDDACEWIKYDYRTICPKIMMLIIRIGEYLIIRTN